MNTMTNRMLLKDDLSKFLKKRYIGEAGHGN